MHEKTPRLGNQVAVDAFAVDTVGIRANRRHCHQLIIVTRRHEHEVPCPGQQLEVRRLRQFARQRCGVLVDGHQFVAIAAVKQHRHMHVGQRVTTEHQTQWRHQHQRVDARVGLRLQVVTVDHQLAFGGAGIVVFRALLAIAAQAVEVRLGARQDQRGFAASGITDNPHLVDVDERRQHRVAQGGGDRFGNLNWPAIQVAHGAEAAVILVVIAGVQHRNYHKPLAGQRGGQVVQGQRRASVAMRQQQHRESADGDLGVFGGGHVVRAYLRGLLSVGRGVKRDGFHRLRIQRVEKSHAMKAHTPMWVRRRGGLH
ncbi:hypothetical protein ALQ18_05151 [Pseudomonas marginalis pv. marginalis]|nr:hypothetical protein ALQ18_05151 [Pseudomonas marginalis pv. marginalis]